MVTKKQTEKKPAAKKATGKKQTKRTAEEVVEAAKAELAEKNAAEEKTEAVNDAGADWGGAMAEQEQAAPAGAEPAAGIEATAPEFDNLQASGTRGAPLGADGSLDRILDIPVTISVEIGRARLLINDLLQLGQGSIVELEKLAGEAMEILVNDRLVARGEVVVVNEKFGIRVTDIVSPVERIKQLRK